MNRPALYVAALEQEKQDLIRLFKKYATKDSEMKEHFLGIQQSRKLFQDHKVALSGDGLSAMLHTIDQDGDGKITLDEFVLSLTDRNGYPEL